MKLAEFAVKNSLFVNLISIFIFFGGMMAMFSVRREAFPEVSFDEVTIQTVYPSASPEDVEKLVTIALEEELKSVSGVKEMNSSSEEGISLIGLKIEPSERDKKKVVDDIQRAVDRVGDLPAEVEDPLVVEMTSKEIPVIEISLSGNFPEPQLRQHAEILEDLLLDINDVSSVRRIGWRDREFWVEVDPGKMKEYYVSFDEVMAALRSRNITVPGGQITLPEVEFNVRITGEFLTPEEVGEVVVRANDDGNWVKVKDIAQVVDTFEDETRIAKINGHRALAMVVVKRENADAIKITDKVKEVVREYQSKLPPGLSVTLTNDYSYYVKRRLGVLQVNGAQGFLLVILILFLFLDPVPAISTALGIPFALLATFGFMYALGISINLITMLGLIIVLGMLVDNGIVASENIYRYIEKGVPVRQAVVMGANEVVSPVLGSILTTWAAFFPLLFMPDIIGKFIRFIPLIVIFALTASLFEAFVILPAHLADWANHPVLKKFVSRHRKANGSQQRWFKEMTRLYTRALQFCIRHRYRFALSLAGAFVVSILLAAFYLKVVLFTGEGIERFFIRAEAKMGTPLKKMDDLIVPIEKLVSNISPRELDSFRTYLGSIETEANFDPNAKRGTHLGQVTVFLTPMQDRKRTPQEIIDSLRPQLEKIQGFEKLYFYMPKEGPPVGNAVAVGVRGEDFNVLLEVAGKVRSILEKTPGVSDISLGYDFGKKQLRVRIDEQKARKYHLTVEQIATTIRNVVEGGLATSIKPSKAEEEINVLVRFPGEVRNRADVFQNIQIANRQGKLVPLLSVATVEETESIYQINHLDGKRVVMVAAEVDNKKATSMSVNQMLKRKLKDVAHQYLGTTIQYKGEFEEQQETLRNLLASFLLVLFFIFIILAREFNSLLLPFLIMVTIPFGFIGVVVTFLLHGRPLSFFAFMGMVGLAGVVVNSAIILVDFINSRRRNGLALLEALVEASQARLRPILMTTGTTIAGLVTVAYGIGGGDPFLKPMALAMMWGLFFAASLTLFAIPCFYHILEDFTQRFFKRPLVALEKE